MDILTKDVTFTPLSRGRARCNVCGVGMKQKQISGHRSTHGNTASPPKMIPRDITLISAEKIEPQKVKVLPSYPGRVVQEDVEDPVLNKEDKKDPSPKENKSKCRHCGHRFTGIRSDCPSCGVEWYVK